MMCDVAVTFMPQRLLSNHPFVVTCGIRLCFAGRYGAVSMNPYVWLGDRQRNIVITVGRWKIDVICSSDYS